MVAHVPSVSLLSQRCGSEQGEMILHHRMPNNCPDLTLTCRRLLCLSSDYDASVNVELFSHRKMAHMKVADNY